VIPYRSLFMVLAIVFIQDCASRGAAAETLPAEIERLLSAPAVQLGGRTAATKELRGFYAPRAFKPLWKPDASESVVAALKLTASDHGLDPAPYALERDLPDAVREVSLSDALNRLGRDLAVGRIPPYRILGGAGENTRPRFDGDVLLKAVALGDDPTDALNRLAPQSPDYRALLTGLATYRAIAAQGGWPPIPDGPSLKPGETDDRLPALRKRLIVTGDLAQDKADGTQLDGDVEAALKRFQGRHGLDLDGAVGKRTLKALNVPVQARIRQIELSLERMRQLPRQRDSARIDVNIAAQALVLYLGGAPTLEMRVITGDVKHQTPTMVTRVASLTVNPTWTVPPSIARKEILPKLKRDPDYLAHNNIRILDAFPEDSPEAEGAGIDWKKMGRSFPYVLRQVPGPDNALGQLKFNLQDQESIYMHDTPQRNFFKRSYRLLSHGCIRLERPLDLADLLLGEKWRGKLPQLIAEGKTKTVILKQSLPVYLLYQTAWADADGTLSFRDDSYGNDQRLEQALGQADTLLPQK